MKKTNQLLRFKLAITKAKRELEKTDEYVDIMAVSCVVELEEGTYFCLIEDGEWFERVALDKNVEQKSATELRNMFCKIIQDSLAKMNAEYDRQLQELEDGSSFCGIKFDVQSTEDARRGHQYGIDPHKAQKMGAQFDEKENLWELEVSNITDLQSALQRIDRTECLLVFNESGDRSVLDIDPERSDDDD